ncbi:hypothetical protein MNBD_PLANCTO02-3235 [hydrothermal vent metagenome]|uniref:Response regulatory domain-containing protein n=1 Tax=hydrothermal vent metagenome TaxID=652676 RepID=A0A3B1D902_9ZZZZ
MTTKLLSPTVPFIKQPGFYPFETKEPLAQSLLRVKTFLVIGNQQLYDWILVHFDLEEIIVQHVSTASEAYQSMMEFPAELVISEIELPDESGWLLAAKLQISHSASQIWLHVDLETATNNRWSGMTSIAPLVCTETLFQPALKKCS